MIEIVAIFGLLNIVFEFVIFAMLPPKLRLRILGSERASRCMHFAMLLINLAIHWGTVTGTMSSILAFCASLITVQIARVVFGSITGSAYKTGLLRYTRSQLV